MKRLLIAEIRERVEAVDAEPDELEKAEKLISLMREFIITSSVHSSDYALRARAKVIAGCLERVNVGCLE